MVATISKLLPQVPVSAGILAILSDRAEQYLDLVYDEWRAALPHLLDLAAFPAAPTTLTSS